MTPQPGTAGTDDDPLDAIETDQLVVNGEVINNLVGLAFDSANASDGVLRFDGTGSTSGITDGSAKVIVGGTVYDVAGAEWVDLSGTKHTVDSWEKVINSQFDVSITGVSPDPVAPGNTLDVTVDVTNNGTDQDTQTVTLDIDNSVGQVDSTSVTLSGGGSVTKTLSWAVPSGQTEQDYQATVSSADDTASQTVTVAAPIVTDHEGTSGDIANSVYDYTNNASITTSASTLEGSYALRTPNGSAQAITSTAQLSPGETLRCEFELYNGNYGPGLIYSLDSADSAHNGYFVAIDCFQPAFVYGTINSGSLSYSTAGFSQSLSTGTKFIFAVDYGGSGNHTLRLLDSSETQLASTNASMTGEASTGFVGAAAAGFLGAYIDVLKIVP